MKKKPELRVAIGGMGAIGLQVAKCLDAKQIPGMALSAVSAKDQEKLQRNIANFQHQPLIPVSYTHLTLPTNREV